MSDFINELKREHSAIKDSLITLSRMDLSSSEANRNLLEIKEILIMHLKKEDQEMYPLLKNVCSGDDHFNSILTYLEDEIKLISQFVFIFFDKYSKNPSSTGLEREFSLICSTLIKRMEKEEEFFFPRYEKLSS